MRSFIDMERKPIHFLPDPELDPFFVGVSEFCKKYLPSDLPREPKSKIIADPVEGYVSLEGWEVSILDTPLFQRLRRISQLALAYLVYPTLGYSRFEHILGVHARLDQVLATLEQNQRRRDGSRILPPKPDHLTKIQLAALCHDVGHCIFSHVSESVIENLPGGDEYQSGGDEYPSATLIKAKFREWARRDLPISEILSIAILTSEPFVEYIQKAGIPSATTRKKAEQIAHHAAYLIAGLPIPGEPDTLFLAQLMNGGLDIDKLDYMFRESLFSGISLGISLQWLMKKLYVAKLRGSQLPDGLRERISKFRAETEFQVLSLEKGGQFGFEEFCVARLALYEKVYLHQKNRAAVAQLKSILAKIAQTTKYKFVHNWLYLSESVVYPPEGEAPGVNADLELFPPDRPSALDWSHIRNRQLPDRAYAFGWQNSISDPLNPDYAVDRTKTGVGQLMRIVEEEPEKFTHTIRRYLKEIVLILTGETYVEQNANNEPEVLIDPPRTKTIQQGTDTIYIECPPRLSLRWVMPIDQIEKYYHWNRALGFVFTNNENVPYILLASEMAAWELCKVVCVQDGLVNSLYVTEAQKHRKILAQQGFYKYAPPLRPVPEDLESIDSQIQIANIAGKLSSYESRSQKRVSPASVTTFVAQFPQNLQNAALTWLQYIELVHPEVQLKEVISELIKQMMPSCKSFGISPLGAPTDSASRLSYSLRDSIEEKVGRDVLIKHLPLSEALALKLDAYIVFDDNTNSGYQALNIFAGWLEKKLPSELVLNEDHVEPLKKELQDELRKKNLLLGFSVATQGALERLKKALATHCGLQSDQIYYKAGRELGPRDRIFSPESTLRLEPEEKSRLAEFLRQTAEQIFLNENKSAKEAESRALGASDAQAMIVFPYNCPTMTISALWLTGNTNEGEWIPLVERGRRKSAEGELLGEDA